MATVQELLSIGVERLRASGSESPRLDAELLLARTVGLDRTRIIAYPEAPVGESAAAAYEADLARREKGEPIAYIRGLKEFHGLAFATDARALIPRPETERVVDLAEAEVVTRLLAAPRPPGTRPVRVVDVGTGAGPIAIALAVALAPPADARRGPHPGDRRSIRTRSGWRARTPWLTSSRIGSSSSSPTCCRWTASCWTSSRANLPYIPTDEIDRLPVAASFEPRGALDGGPDGLDPIRALVERLPRVLGADGVALLEIGSDQADAVTALVAERVPDWTCEVLPDLAGLPRVARIEPAQPEPAR